MLESSFDPRHGPTDATDAPDAPHTTGAQSAAAERPLWRQRDFMLLWSGQVVSSVGSRVSLIAFPLLLLLLTGSPAQAGLVTALRGIPYVLLMLPAGALVDRWDRKRVMVGCDSARALALGSVALAAALGRLSLPQIGAVALVDGLGDVFFGTAEVSALPRIVLPTQLAAAGAQYQLIDSLAWLLGPSLGGVLFGVGAGLPFLVDAVSYVCSVAALLGMRARFQEQRQPAPARIRQLLAETRAGVVWLWREPVLRFLAVLTCGLMTCVSGYSLLVIVLVAFGSQPLGLAITGLLLQRFGLVSAVLITFAPQAALAVVTSFYGRLRATA